MLSYDVDFSINMHFELDENEALDRGGVDLSLVKKQIQELPDWVMAAITEYIDFGERDSISVIPYDNKLVRDGEIIDLNDVAYLPSDGSESEGTEEKTLEEVEHDNGV